MIDFGIPLDVIRLDAESSGRDARSGGLWVVTEAEKVSGVEIAPTIAVAGDLRRLRGDRSQRRRTRCQSLTFLCA